ncbi:MAG: tripartite tricarboxylate transporter TctB family protein [Candidatus Heteroscillospira sp.]|jgi:putative tricarboxylic transport membrane protein
MVAKYKEFMLGIGITLLALVYGYAATHIKVRVVTAIGPQYIPYGLAALCLILGLAQMRVGWNKAKAYVPEEHQGEQKDNLSVFLLFVSLAVYVATLKSVGFLITTTILCFVLQVLLCPKQKRKYGVFVIVAVVSTVFIYFSFRYGLGLMLPAGIVKF